MTSILDPEQLVDPHRLDEVLALTAAEMILLGSDRGGSLVVVGEGETGVRELVDLALTRARGMVAAGLAPGQRVLVILPPSADAVVWAWAVILAGGAVVMVSTRNSDREIRRYAAVAEARWVISSRGGDGVLASADAHRMFGAPASAELPIPLPDWEVACFATSGSTGPSKLARFSNRIFPAQAISYQHMIGGGPDDVIMFPQPMAHVAFVPQVHFPLLQGRRLIVLPEFTAQTVVDIAAAERATVMGAVPTMWQLILDRTDFESRKIPLRRCTYAAAPMPAPLARRLIDAARCEVVHAYGLTEAGGVMTMLSPEKVVSKAGSAGSLLAPQDGIAILDPATDEAVQAGAVGEICFRGPAATLGYIGQDDATADLWRGDWLHTGDLGHLDHDGDLWITGRLKEQISRGGLKVGAREVELAIEEMPGVIGAGVIGLADPVLGERIGAAVEVGAGGSDPDAIRNFVAERLGDYKRPDVLVIVAELPRNAMGKIDKSALRVLLQDQTP